MSSARSIAPLTRTRLFRRFAPTVLPVIERLLSRLTGGRVQLSALLVPSLVLHTIGAKSGEPRDAALMYTPDGQGRAIVAGTNFAGGRHPAWTANLLAHPDAAITVRGRRMPVRAEACPTTSATPHGRGSRRSGPAIACTSASRAARCACSGCSRWRAAEPVDREDDGRMTRAADVLRAAIAPITPHAPGADRRRGAPGDRALHRPHLARSGAAERVHRALAHAPHDRREVG